MELDVYKNLSFQLSPMNRRGFFIEGVRVAETWLPTIIPQSTESQRIGNQIDAAMIPARPDFVNVL